MMKRQSRKLRVNDIEVIYEVDKNIEDNITEYRIIWDKHLLRTDEIPPKDSVENIYVWLYGSKYYKKIKSSQGHEGEEIYHYLSFHGSFQSVIPYVRSSITNKVTRELEDIATILYQRWNRNNSTSTTKVITVTDERGVEYNTNSDESKDKDGNNINDIEDKGKSYITVSSEIGTYTPSKPKRGRKKKKSSKKT